MTKNIFKKGAYVNFVDDSPYRSLYGQVLTVLDDVELSSRREAAQKIKAGADEETLKLLAGWSNMIDAIPHGEVVYDIWINQVGIVTVGESLLVPNENQPFASPYEEEVV